MIRALVEVSSDLTRQQQKDLVTWAYGLSRTGRVLLLLRGVTRDAADRLLDDVVAEEGLDVKGLLYEDAGDDTDCIVRQALGVPLVVVSTEPLRSHLLNRGVRVLPPGAAATAEPMPRREHRAVSFGGRTAARFAASPAALEPRPA